MRHAATPWNEEGRFQGLSDIALSAEGRRQARRAGGRLETWLRGQGIAASALAWRCSPLARATGTMRILRQGVGLEPDGFVTDERLAEAGFGRWEGLTTHEVKARFPDERRQRRSDRWNFAPVGGGSHAELSVVMDAFLESLSRDRTTVIVTHSGNIRVLLRLLLGLGEAEAMAYAVPHEVFWHWTGERLLTA